MKREDVQRAYDDNPDNAGYDISIIEKRGKLIAVYRVSGQFNVDHIEIVGE